MAFDPPEARKVELFNLSAEAAVLGGILYQNTAFWRVRDLLKADDFYHPAHQYLFQIVAERIEADGTADPVTLAPLCDADPHFRDAGGNAYLAQVFESAAFGPEVGDYARIIRDLAHRRSLVDIGNSLIESAEGFADRSVTADDLNTEATLGLESLAARQSTAEWHSAASAVSEEIGRLETMGSSGKPRGIPTGISKFDAQSGGLHRGDLLVLGGRPSMGKTAFAMNLCLGAARNEGVRVAIFSMEMSDEQLSWRLASSEARRFGFGKVEYQAMRNGTLGQNELAILRAGEKNVPKALTWNTARGLTFNDLRASLRKAKRKFGKIDVICIDYLQIMSIIPERGQTKSSAIGDVTMGLKQLAGDENLSVILLSQLSRDLERRDNKRPMMSDLRESGAIEQDADAIVFAYRDEYYLERAEPAWEAKEVHAEWMLRMGQAQNRLEAIFAKNRMGPIGTVSLHFEKETDVIVDDEALLSEEVLF
ncbi:MAG: DnaB-like helicase C-terminal domain-containing protein [Pseudomonadota bacterium]